MLSSESKIVLCGGAGLVGQNLIDILDKQGYKNLTVIDKHKENIKILKNLFPGVTVINADLAFNGDWEDAIEGTDFIVMLQAQIGGNKEIDFNVNNLNSTKNILKIYKQHKVGRLVHVSSSVVNSAAEDFYSKTKRMQELLVLESKIKCPILRPTLMFGWFDRKHFGWLSRLMKKSPVFPIPGDGKYLRQPLYVRDFCKIILSCMKNQDLNGAYNISGLEKVFYIDIISQIKKVMRSKVLIMKIPYKIFFILIKIWMVFDKNPPFTTQQLEALVIKEEFEIINWPEIFEIESTPYHQAIDETFSDSRYSRVKLDF
jgi:nucleoside-diphosphate-sugar epimerase